MTRREMLAGAALLPWAASAEAGMETDMESIEPGVVELRQYTLLGGRRDALISLFEREFVESQAAVGAHVLGTFRDLDDPDRFVWVRGFADMRRRRAALETFYRGEVWRAHRQAANATMLDSDNVLLLRPRRALAPAAGAAASGPGLYGARIFQLGSVDAAAFGAWFDAELAPRLAEIGAGIMATLVTEAAPNDFPALPVRGDRVFAWIARWADAEAEAGFERRFAAMSGWRDAIPPELLPALMRKPERLRLAPTARSLMT